MREKQVNQSGLLELKRKFEVGNNKKYKVKSIVNNMIYGKKAKN